MGEITNWSSGGTPPKDNPLFWNGDIPWISASSMRGLTYSNSENKITQEGLKTGSKLATKGTLLILVRGSMLFNKIPIGIVSKDVSFNQDVKSVTVNDCSTPEFILNWFLASETKLLNMVTGTGIGAGKLDLQDLKELEIKTPFLPEQHKIASFLSLITERIETQNKIIKELNVLKTTITKGIFSGQLRFKDENKNDFPDWEEKKLGEIANIKSGLSKDQNGNSNGYKVTRIETISDGTINVTKIGYITFDGNIDDYKIKKGDILFSNINSVSHIGKTAIAYSDLDLYHGMNLLCIKSKYELNPLFLYYYLNTVKIRDYFKSICNKAVSQASINQTELGKTIIVLPGLKEQTKIANFLYSIYSKIDIETQVLQKIEEQKKYLLANLFI